MIFLMETKHIEASCERVRREVVMDNVEYVLPMGNSIGMALCWAREVSVFILRKEKHLIDCKVSSSFFGVDFLYNVCL